MNKRVLKYLYDRGFINLERPDEHYFDVWNGLNRRWQYWLFVFAQDLLPYDLRCEMRADPATKKNLKLAGVAGRLCAMLEARDAE